MRDSALRDVVEDLLDIIETENARSLVTEPVRNAAERVSFALDGVYV